MYNWLNEKTEKDKKCYLIPVQIFCKSSLLEKCDLFEVSTYMTETSFSRPFLILG